MDRLDIRKGLAARFIAGLIAECGALLLFQKGVRVHVLGPLIKI
ncbi:hypothetical protein MEA186_03689 [Mesorhizobium amorphae CCNWGS0123]|uniref:Uncharacterized protein n=1 Tax=Mesorhizobium amorphae CCNWGS0123 TaxID=1082933 RepID=G6Y479_9HYPH|nr:hypothetical protein MEA186_03689 [Mesorhizobium amorphae CCNWGS0123]